MPVDNQTAVRRLPSGFHDLRHQPFRSLYLIYSFFTLLFVRIPIWTLLSLPRSNRSRPSWSIGGNVVVKVMYQVMSVIEERSGFLIDLPNHKAARGGKGVKSVWVEAVPNLITGQLKAWAEVSNVDSISIPGYWMDSKGSDTKAGERAKPGEKVIYHLHGGGYFFLSAHPSSPTSEVVKGLLEYLPSIRRAFCLEYRLSTSEPYPESNAFPAALLDAIAGYSYLVNLGFEPANIIIAGDSAGGNLTLALTRYLLEYQDSDIQLPACPGNILLLSPWADLSSSHNAPGTSTYTNANSDYIDTSTSATTDYALRSFLGRHGHTAAELNPYISPASKRLEVEISFKGFPRTMIVAGEAEVMFDQIITLRDRMTKDLGEKVAYYQGRDSIHDYLGFAFWEPQRSDTLKAIAEWLS